MEYCSECGGTLLPFEENRWICPKCERAGQILGPYLCDFCREHPATTPSDNGRWICDYCIVKTLVGEQKFHAILAVQQEMGTPDINTAVAEWRRHQL